MPEEFYREEQWFPRFVGALLGGMSALAAAAMVVRRSNPPAWARQLVMGTGGLLGLTGALAPMRTLVTEEGITITFGLAGWVRFHIDANEIQSAAPTSYHPLTEFGGWGIRFSFDGTRAYTARGGQGVRVQTDRRAFLIGSQEPHALARAIERTITTKAA